MKKTIIFVIVVALLTFFYGCGNEKQEITTKDTSQNNADTMQSDTYIEMAQSFIEKGDYDAAISILEKGLESTNDEAISKLLDEVKQKQELSKGDYDKGNEGGDASSDNATDNQDTYPDLDTDQMIIDLVDSEENTFYLNYEKQVLSLKRSEIVRQQLSGNEKEIHINVQWENDKYGAVTEYVLYYRYFDDGGWWLEDYYITSSQSYARKSLYTDMEFSELLMNHFDSVTVVERTQNEGEFGINYERIDFTAELEFSYLDVQFNGWYVLEYVDDVWYTSSKINNYEYDFKKMLGTWEYVYDNGDYVRANIDKMCINYSNINLNKSVLGWDEAECYISYSTSAWNWINYYAQDNKPYTQGTLQCEPGHMYIWVENREVYGQSFLIPEKIWFAVNLGKNSRGDNYSGNIVIMRDEGCTLSWAVGPSNASETYQGMMTHIIEND